MCYTFTFCNLSRKKQPKPLENKAFASCTHYSYHNNLPYHLKTSLEDEALCFTEHWHVREAGMLYY